MNRKSLSIIVAVSLMLGSASHVVASPLAFFIGHIGWIAATNVGASIQEYKHEAREEFAGKSRDISKPTSLLKVATKQIYTDYVLKAEQANTNLDKKEMFMTNAILTLLK